MFHTTLSHIDKVVDDIGSSVVCHVVDDDYYTDDTVVVAYSYDKVEDGGCDNYS
jgi:hypothetical protein